MKLNFTNRAILLLMAVVTFSLTACEKGEDEVTPDEVNCKMITFSIEGQGNSSIQYNEKGYISKVLSTEEDEEGKVVVSEYTYFYNDNNQVIKIEERRENNLRAYTEFGYANNLLISTKEYLSDGTLDYLSSYKHNSNGKVVEINNQPTGGPYIYTSRYTYDSKGNVVKEEAFEDGILDARFVYSDYDDKSNPFLFVKGEPVSGDFFLSNNNPGKAVSTSFRDLDGDGISEEQESETIVFKYEYNEDGIPLKISIANAGSNSDIFRFTYECK